MTTPKFKESTTPQCAQMQGNKKIIISIIKILKEQGVEKDYSGSIEKGTPYMGCLQIPLRHE